MAKMIITEDLLPIAGEYEFDFTYFTHRELHLIKKQTGIRAGELMEAFEAGDMDAAVAFAMVVLERAGKGRHRELLWDAKVGEWLTFEFEEDGPGDEEVPPDGILTTGTGDSENDTGVRSISSGKTTEPSSDSRENVQSLTGTES